MAVTDRATRVYWDGAGLVRLACGLFAAPAAWLIDLEASYATVKWVCAHDRREVLFLIPSACLVVIALATWMCWSAWGMLRHKTVLEGGAIEDRSGFLAVVGLMMNATFAVLIIATFPGRYLLGPCE
jgi:hypothetical protein